MSFWKDPLNNILGGTNNLLNGFSHALAGFDTFVRQTIPGGWATIGAAALMAAGIEDPELLSSANAGTLTPAQIASLSDTQIAALQSVATPEIAMQSYLSGDIGLSQAIQAGTSIGALTDVGVGLGDLVTAGASSGQLISAGYGVGDIYGAGMSAAQIFQGATIPQLLGGGASIGQIVGAAGGPANLTPSLITNILSAASSVANLTGAAPLAQLLSAGATYESIAATGMTAANMLSAGATVASLLGAKAPIIDLLSAGANVNSLLNSGATVGNILGSGAVAANLLGAPADVQRLLSAGASVNNLYQSGMNINALLNANVPKADVQAAVQQQAAADPTDYKQTMADAWTLGDSATVNKLIQQNNLSYQDIQTQYNVTDENMRQLAAAGVNAPYELTSTGYSDSAPGTVFTGANGQQDIVLASGKTVPVDEYIRAQESGQVSSLDGQIQTKTTFNQAQYDQTFSNLKAQGLSDTEAERQALESLDYVAPTGTAPGQSNNAVIINIGATGPETMPDGTTQTVTSVALKMEDGSIKYTTVNGKADLGQSLYVNTNLLSDVPTSQTLDTSYNEPDKYQISKPTVAPTVGPIEPTTVPTTTPTTTPTTGPVEPTTTPTVEPTTTPTTTPTTGPVEPTTLQTVELQKWITEQMGIK